jgi:cytochrome P450
LFTLAGLDTVTGTIGFVLLHLARNPDLRRSIIEDPSLIAPTIEEIIRLESVAPSTPRFTTQDVELCGKTIPGGAMCFLMLGTANRDEARFANPNEIDLAHADSGHLGFGGGIHRCLGSHLARRELRLVVEEFHRVIPEYAVAEGAVPEIVWPSGTLHLRSLPLVFPSAVG